LLTVTILVDNYNTCWQLQV